jgi:N-acetylneuraminic acid mutarotase
MNAAMAYDSGKHRLLLFGGRTETGTENDLWSYDGKSWTKINTSASPVARQLGLMAFDKRNAQFVLFGGMDTQKNPLGDTWILKNDQWTQLDAKGPVPRASACATYDDALGAVVIYGGYINNAASKEFWEFKDGAWHDLTQESGPVRIHASLTYDPAKRRLLMFGGFGEQGRTNELWQYADNRWTQLSVAEATPAPRAEHRSVFIPGKGLFVFGGVIGPDPNTRNRGNDTWLYDAKSWKALE